MPVTVVVGGQFGSEGKGKVAHFLAQEMGASIAVRVGGPNSGHTVIDPCGNAIVLRQLPTASILSDTVCGISAGSYISPDVLLAEMKLTSLEAERLLIDPNAVIITEVEEHQERESSLRQSIGSTQSGTGAAVLKRIFRSRDITLAGNDERLKPFIKPVLPFLRNRLMDKQRVIIEGTQGFGLSLLHSPYYPYVTSRDTTASGFVSEAGLSPLDIDDVVMVLRAFPIRVSGNSGPLPEEVTWQEVTTTSGSDEPLVEHTSVTKAVRRVARFHPDVVLRAMMANNPTRIFLNHVDYVDRICFNSDALTMKAAQFVNTIESTIGASINYVGTGPSSVIKRVHTRAVYKFA
jgi:adenylosuccinate synthase